MNLTAVTGFYDVGRAGLDGRDVRKYVEWLNETLRFPLPFIVFLDPAFDASRVRLKAEDRIVRVALEDLTIFRHQTRIEEICGTEGAVNHRDIASKLPAYGMLVMSKPEFMKRAAVEADTDGLIWIDAGLGRYLPDLTNAAPVRGAADLAGTSMAINTTNHLRQSQRLGRLPHANVGSCLALMAAGDFYVTRDFAPELSNRLDFMVQNEWLPNGRWDNEQVAIGTLLFRGGLPGARAIATTIGHANVTRWLFGLPLHDPTLPLFLRWRMLRDEIRIRTTPESACYLPGDFPEADFQEWLRKSS